MTETVPLLVCILAHNEGKHIRRCLASVAATLPQQRVTEVYVVANGCRDNTAQAAAAFSDPRVAVRVVELAVGDKSNAWNHFTYEIAPSHADVIFVDGDVWLAPDVVDKLRAAQRAHPEALCIAAAPGSGRNGDDYRRRQLAERSLWGNCYLATGTFLDAMRQHQLRLPVGYICEDGLLETIAKTNFLKVPWTLTEEAVHIEPSAHFLFDSMGLADLPTYLRRRVRYSTRMMQRQLLYPRLRIHGPGGMPAAASDLYDDAVLSLRPRGDTNSVFDALAIRRLRSWMKRRRS